MQWFRMYAEFAYDPKVQSLSETLQRRYIMLLCVTCNGEIKKMTTDEMAFALRIGESDLETTLKELKSKRLIDDNNIPCAWDKRQYISDDSNIRVKRHRELKRKRNADATNCNVTVTPPDTDTDTDNKKVSKNRGTRFTLAQCPDEWINFCNQERPDLIPQNVFDDFRDYWIAVAGAKGVKLDWLSTWRRWVRNQKKEGGFKHQPQKTEKRSGAITL